MDCAIASLNVTCLVIPDISPTFLGPLPCRAPFGRRVRRAVAMPLVVASEEELTSDAVTNSMAPTAGQQGLQRHYQSINQLIN